MKERERDVDGESLLNREALRDFAKTVVDKAVLGKFICFDFEVGKIVSKY